MKKLILLLIFGILLVGTVSAWDWDNSITYEKKDMTAIIENRFGLPLIGDVLGKMELTSHTSVNEIKNIIGGGERAVMIYNPSNWKQETISLGKVIFTNMKTGKEVDKNYYFAEGVYEEVPAYKQVCKNVFDKNANQEIPYCNQVQNGTYIKRVGWKRLENQEEVSSNIKEIALMTYVGINDYYDAIWTIEGKPLTKHAEWTSSFNVGLKAYYTLNHTLSDSLGNHNLTLGGGSETYEAGVINASFWGSGDDFAEVDPTFSLNESDDGWAESMWVYQDSFLGYRSIFPFGHPANNFQYVGVLSGSSSGGIFIFGSSDGSNWDCASNLDIGFTYATKHHLVVMWDRSESNLSLWYDGISKGELSCTGFNLGDESGMGIFLFAAGADGLFNGWIDEIGIWNRTLSSSEISDLYNAGNGISYRLPISPTVTLNYPNDGANFSTTSVSFNCSATDDSQVSNITLYLDDVAQTTETGSEAYLEWNNTLTLSEGNHNYTCYACDDESLCNWASTNKTFTIDIGVSVTQSAPVNYFNTTNNTPELFVNFSSTGAETINDTYIYVYDSLGNLDYETSDSGGIGTNSYNTSFITSSLDDDIYHWNASVLGSLGSTAGTGLWYFTLDTTTPTTAIVYPLNTTYRNDITELNYTYSDKNPGRCLYSTDNWVTNSSTVSAGTNFTGITSTEGSNTFNLYCNDSLGNHINSSVTFFMDSLLPIITWDATTKSDGYNSTVDWIYAGVNVTETNEQNITFLLWNITEEVDRTSYFTAIRNINWTSLPDANYTYNVTVCDNFNNCNTSSTRSLVIGATFPIITSNSPIGSIGFQHTLPFNVSLNFTSSEILLQACWYNSTFNSTITIITCNTANNVSVANPLNQTIYAYANTSFGLETMSSLEFYPDIVELSQHFNTQTTEGAIERFRINVSIVEGASISTANLIYNNTKYMGGSFSNIGGRNFTIYKDLTIPSVTAITNNTFWWNITLNGFEGSSSKNNQSVFNFAIDDCSVYGILILNYSLLDEKTQTNLGTDNTTIKIHAILSSFGTTTEVVNFSQLFNNINPAQVCIGGLQNETQYTLDVITSYQGKTHEIEYHNIQNFTLSNNTIPQNINLYDINTTESTDFLITFKDENFLLVDNALIDITRYYITDGIFKSVEVPKTDNDGQTIAHLVRNDVIYTIIVSKYGKILATFENKVAVCADYTIGDCIINLNAFTTGTIPTDFKTVGDLTYTLSFDETTRTVTVIFTSVSGANLFVQLNSTKFDALGNKTICSDSITTSSGTLTCTIPDSFGNTTIITELYSGDDLITSSSFSIKEDVFDTFGYVGIIMLLILVMILPFIFISNRNGMIIGTIIGLVIGGLLNLFTGGSMIGIGSYLIWIVIAGGIIIWKNSQGSL